MTASDSVISDLVTATLATLANDMTLGLGSTEDARRRFLGTEDTPRGARLRIASEGLTLDHKMKLERAILVELRKANELATIEISGINFIRTSPSTAGVTPIANKPNHKLFGLNIDKKAIPGVRHVIVVASGKGGVGKSTVSANLAVALSTQGQRVGLMDCDVYGPSVPTLLGIRGDIVVGPQGKLIPKIGHNIKAVSFGFLSDAKSPVLWRGPLVSKAVEQLCYDVEWGDIDTLVVDMPPGTGDIQMTIAERLPIHAALIVTTPQDVALLDAHKAVSMFERLQIPIAGVVENMAWYECPKCGHEDHVFGQESFREFLTARKLNLLGRIPLRKEIRIDSDEGRPPALQATSPWGAPYHHLAREILRFL